jgi:UTP--glucose-1-phosphate uridylyltransferase
MISKAIIPAGGLGTRMLPATLAVPKEMLPVAGLPMIHYAVAEAFRSGIREICIIVAPGKRSIAEYFLHRPLDSAAADERTRNVLNELARIREEARFLLLEQTEPKGLGDAIWQARDFIDGSPFALLLPDNIFTDPVPVTARLIEAWQTHKLDTIALHRVADDEAPLLGNCGGVRCRPLAADEPDGPGRCHRIEDLQDKGPGHFRPDAGYTLRTAPRHVLNEHFFYYLARQRRDREGGGELDDVPVLQEIIRSQGMTGVLVGGRVLDAGSPAGYARANVVLGNEKAGPGEGPAC